MPEPSADRPYMPGYGILGREGGRGLLPWAWALERLHRSHDFWLATAWPDGRPHLMPVWAVWLDDALWFSSSRGSRKARNLDADPRCSAATDDPRNPVVLEGAAELIVDEGWRARFVDATNAKYDTAYTLDFLDPAANSSFRIQPRSAFAVADGRFEDSPTRWTFTP